MLPTLLPRMTTHQCYPASVACSHHGIPRRTCPVAAARCSAPRSDIASQSPSHETHPCRASKPNGTIRRLLRGCGSAPLDSPSAAVAPCRRGGCRRVAAFRLSHAVASASASAAGGRTHSGVVGVST